jgi:hypothetical protein
LADLDLDLDLRAVQANSAGQGRGPIESRSTSPSNRVNVTVEVDDLPRLNVYLARMARRQPSMQKTPQDTILLLHGMMVMSDFKQEAEAAVLDTFLKTLPEFRMEDVDELKAAVAKIRAEYPTAKDSCAALAGISNPLVKKKTFILALDIAMASGAIDATEDELLEELRTVLKIDLETAESILDVLAVKYAS